jgi:hypothetical protein
MRVEREHNRWAVNRFRTLQEPLDDSHVPAVYAIEVPDRHGTAASSGGKRIERADDVHGKEFATEDTESTERKTN